MGRQVQSTLKCYSCRRVLPRQQFYERRDESRSTGRCRECTAAINERRYLQAKLDREAQLQLAMTDPEVSQTAVAAAMDSLGDGFKRRVEESQQKFQELGIPEIGEDSND